MMLFYYLWKSSINNHLWWSVQTYEGNEKKLIDKFTSIIKHISNERSVSGKIMVKKRDANIKN